MFRFLLNPGLAPHATQEPGVTGTAGGSRDCIPGCWPRIGIKILRQSPRPSPAHSHLVVPHLKSVDRGSEMPRQPHQACTGQGSRWAHFACFLRTGRTEQGSLLLSGANITR
ncbi:mCG147291 [Mus musculus]|nr:mCG147291 [Mus musculus]